MFKFESINNKKILTSDILPKNNATHLFTTRETVVTPKEIDELVDIAKVNLEQIAKYLNIPVENIISPEQTHSSNIAVAVAGKSYPNTDAMVVDSPDIAILLNFADCTPVILYDPEHNVGAIAHAGWKGTVARIVPKTMEFMSRSYDTNPQKIVAIIGPAISISNYQVDTDVFQQLESSMLNKYNDYYQIDNVAKKYNVDLKTINKHQLEELGTTRIDMCQYCTYDSVDVFFSYRKEQGRTARHSALLKLNKYSIGEHINVSNRQIIINK